MRSRNSTSSLGELADPTKLSEPINCNAYAADQNLQFLRSMLDIRSVEEVIGYLTETGEAKCPCHLGIGQEAVAVGVSFALRATDRIFGAHRSHPHFIAAGGSTSSLLHEVLGKFDGASHGMGGSMHLYDHKNGFYGSVPIVAGTIPLAVGAALAAKMDGNGDIAIAYFGDGACEEGVLHESLNLSAQLSLPILFVAENNLYSSHLDISERQPDDRLARFADAHRVTNSTLDGNDVCSVATETERMVNTMRTDPAPAFLECVTYRWRGHVGADENVDVGVRRRAEDLKAWKLRDPIVRLAEGLGIGRDDLEKMKQEVALQLETELNEARKAPYPEISFNEQVVYA